jgi:hypothetical protein
MDATTNLEPKSVLDGYLTKGEFATQLRVSARTLDRWETHRTGPPRTIVGKTVYYRVDAVRDWLKERERRKVRG